MQYSSGQVCFVGLIGFVSFGYVVVVSAILGVIPAVLCGCAVAMLTPAIDVATGDPLLLDHTRWLSGDD